MSETTRVVSEALRKVASEDVIKPDIFGMMPPATMYDVIVLLHAVADELEKGCALASGGTEETASEDYISPRGKVRRAYARIVSRRKGAPLKIGDDNDG